MSQPDYIPFNDWLPDLIDLNNPALEIAKNCLPAKDGFKSFPSFVRESSNAITGDAKGLFSGEDGTGSNFTFVGDQTSLYRYTGAQAFDNVSKAGGYTNTAFWDFTLWENQTIATNFNDPVQEFTFGSSALFADLGGSPPNARYVATVRDFVLLANINDGASKPYTVRNSARADPTDWTISSTTQASSFDVYDSGPITGLVGGGFGTLFTTGGVYRLTYIGSPIVFQRDEIGNGLGCEIPGSIVKRIESRGELAFTYFRTRDGFAVTDGSTVREIGNDRVNLWFEEQFDKSRANQLTAGIYGLRDSVVWSFPSTTSTGQNDAYIAFNFSTNKWSYGEIDVEQLGLTNNPGVTLDEIDSLVDDVTELVDSSVWDGSGSAFGAIDHEGFFGTFRGPALNAEFVTGEKRYGPGKSRFGRMWPDCDGTVTTEVASGETYKQIGTYGPASTMRRGYTSHRGTSQKDNFHKIRMKTTGPFSECKGLTVEVYKGNV